MNKTAVEWLQEKISYITPSGNIITYHGDMTNVFEQAKIMELEQMTEAWKEGYDLAINGGRIPKL